MMRYAMLSVMRASSIAASVTGKGDSVRLGFVMDKKLNARAQRRREMFCSLRPGGFGLDICLRRLAQHQWQVDVAQADLICTQVRGRALWSVFTVNVSRYACIYATVNRG